MGTQGPPSYALDFNTRQYLSFIYFVLDTRELFSGSNSDFTGVQYNQVHLELMATICTRYPCF